MDEGLSSNQLDDLADERGLAADDPWDPVSQTLKIFDVTGDFLKEDSIIGKITNNKGATLIYNRLYK